MCGEHYYMDFVANFILFLAVKKIEIKFHSLSISLRMLKIGYVLAKLVLVKPEAHFGDTV